MVRYRYFRGTRTVIGGGSSSGSSGGSSGSSGGGGTTVSQPAQPITTPITQISQPRYRYFRGERTIIQPTAPPPPPQVKTISATYGASRSRSKVTPAQTSQAIGGLIPTARATAFTGSRSSTTSQPPVIATPKGDAFAGARYVPKKRVSEVRPAQKISALSKASRFAGQKEIEAERAFATGKIGTGYAKRGQAFIAGAGVGIASLGIGVGLAYKGVFYDAPRYALTTPPKKLISDIGKAPRRTAQTVSKVGLLAGKTIREKPAYSTGFAASSLIGFKGLGKLTKVAKTKAVSSITKVRGKTIGDVEIVRRGYPTKNILFEESGLLGEVKVSKQLFGKEFGTKAYNVGGKSIKTIIPSTGKIETKSAIMVSRGKELSFFDVRGKGIIKMKQQAKIQIAGGETREVLSVGGQEISKISPLFKSASPSARLKTSLGGELLEVTRKVKGKFTVAGEAKTQYIVSSREISRISRGTTGEAVSRAEYKFLGTPTKRIERGVADVRGTIYPQKISKQPFFAEAYNPKTGEFKFSTANIKKSIGKRGQISITRTIQPTKQRIKPITKVSPRPAITLFEESKVAAKSVYLGRIKRSRTLYAPISISRKATTAIPRSRTITRSITRPVTRDITKPITRSITKPVTRDITKPITRSITKPFTKSLTKPLTRSITSSATKPKTKPIGVRGSPTSRPFGSIIAPPIVSKPPPVIPKKEFIDFRLRGGRKQKQTESAFSPKYFSSVEARAFGIKGKRPSKKAIATGIALRPIIRR